MEPTCDFIRANLSGRTVRNVPVGTPVRDVCSDRQAESPLAVLGALVNNDVVSLSYPLEVDSDVDILTLADQHGWHIYRYSMSFLLSKAVSELYPAAKIYVEHSLGSGFYCNFQSNGAHGITPEQIEKLAAYMRELVAQDIPILRRKVIFSKALEYFEEHQQRDILNLLRFKNPPKIVLYKCGDFIDVSHGPLADSTGALSYFSLIPYAPGFVLQFPDRENPPDPAPFEPQPQLFQIYSEYKNWGRVLGVRTAGDLNEIIAENRIQDFIMIAEALHEKKLAKIADIISEQRDHVKWVLIAGPSSSGKTTFAKRLSVQLRVMGLRPVTISVDNYFVNRDDTPCGDDGEFDFEHIETIDLDLFNTHLKMLDEGKEVEVPVFNFSTGKREYHGETLRIEKGQMALIEGIHSLNPRLTAILPAEHKFRIYISALTQLNLDFSTRISTTDNRLIRRMVRDHQFRGHSALRTLRMWPSVRAGEKRWIFPFQAEADIAFNSALDYELAMLKPRVEPLLAEIKPYDPEYATARRMQDFLSGFISAPADYVPAKSILREFLGQSSFRY
ncbi:MAG: nucleoside kinase [Spartobacteria bacterium]|nr:nucleoside kinase [Spartobacteria bacterium]